MFPAWFSNPQRFGGYKTRCRIDDGVLQAAVLPCQILVRKYGLDSAKVVWGYLYHDPVKGRWVLRGLQVGHIARRGSHHDKIRELDNVEPQSKDENLKAAGVPQWSREGRA